MDNTQTISAQQRIEINLVLKKLAEKRIYITPFLDYYDGKHAINFASDKFRTKFGERLRKFRDNLCRTCVVAPCDRLEVVSFSDEDQKDVFDEGWSAWKYSSMPRLAKRVHKEAFKTGDAYAVVWKDENEQARIYVQDSKTTDCAVWYDTENGKIIRGAKCWRSDTDKKYYLTIYYTDRIEKYISKTSYSLGTKPGTAGAFLIREVEGETFPLENPSGICPMFHFGLETSILTDVMPLNDALNKEICDMLIGSEANSRREKWSTGISYEVDDETGKKIIPFDDDGKWFTTEKEQGKFGEFAQLTLADFLEVINDFRMEIARVTGIPAYYFMLEKSAIPSGEALKKAESRFTALIQDAQRDFGEVWAQIVAFALWINGEMELKLALNTKVETNWAPASPMSENELLDLAGKKKNIGVSNKRLQSEVGYSDADIEEIAQEKADETEAAAASFSKAFDAGTAGL